MSDIALKYTGQIGQWEAIAAYNQISNPLTLRIGDMIIIPASMVPAQNVTTGSTTTASSNRDTSSGVAAPTTGSLAVKRTRDVKELRSKIGDVQIAPVNTNRSFELNPIETSSPKAPNDNSSSPPRIRVIGSYYPKGIYQQPASYSRLMMRVAPGTIFELEQEVNDWYKIVTEQGVGYIRMVDGTLLTD